VAERLRILLADDNPAILDVLKRMLQKDFVIAGSASSAMSLLRQTPEVNPDVIILDVSLGDLNGFDVTRQLRSGNCAAKIIFLTVHEDFEFVRAAFDAGASGYVFKSRMNTDLRAALEAVKNGKVFIPDASLSQ